MADTDTNVDAERSIAERAYAIWEGEGRTEGGAEMHWAQAEAEYRADLALARAATATDPDAGSESDLGLPRDLTPERGAAPRAGRIAEEP